MQDKLNKSRAQTASLGNGLTLGTTIHPYVGTDPQTDASATGTSIFDPVLAELVYRWFCPPGGLVLDPFAGGSVRGIVASRLGRQYLGIDLRPEQVAANEMQAKLICKAPLPQWICGDALDVVEFMGKRKAHLIFSCPPYADLEVYSDDERDLSTMDHAEFLKAYSAIIGDCAKCLADDSFACFVIGEARGPDGNYYGLVARTVEAFEAAGLPLYNNAILVTVAGSLPIRTAKQFTVSRKLGTTHQHCLVFLKGDAVEATKAIGAVDFGEILEGAPPASPEQDSGTAPAPKRSTPPAPPGSANLADYGDVL
jgi:hypothetical protein